MNRGTKINYFIFSHIIYNYVNCSTSWVARYFWNSDFLMNEFV